MKRKVVLMLSLVMLLASLLTGCNSQVTGICKNCKQELPLYVVTAQVGNENPTKDICCKACASDIEKAYNIAKDMGYDVSITVEPYVGK